MFLPDLQVHRKLKTRIPSEIRLYIIYQLWVQTCWGGGKGSGCMSLRKVTAKVREARGGGPFI